MSELRPCTACDRHVAIGETSCPFCAAPLAPAAPRPRVFGRLSRAAVFASATLATAAACGGKTKPDPNANTNTNTHTNTAATDAGVTPDAPVVIQPDQDHFIPKPYGAPPARRRLV